MMIQKLIELCNCTIPLASITWLSLQFTFYSHPRRSNQLGNAVHEFGTEHWIPDAANVGVGNEHCTILYNIELHGGKIRPEDMTKIETHLFGEPAARAARNEATFSAPAASSTTASSVAAASTRTFLPTVARGRGRGIRTQTQTNANSRGIRRGDEPLQQSLVRSALTRYESSLEL